MQKIKEIKSLHIELTDKCQAQCPMCARNHYGGKTRDFIQNIDISIEKFKDWFPKKFLSQLENFYSCGNYGDPVIAKDCLEIYAYVRECNPTARLAIHTNGSLRTPDWWEKLAQYNVEVIFAIDGFKGKHELYRRNTNFDKIIENIKSFISKGGTARVDSLVFKHNENDTEDLEKFLLELGVKNVNFVSTTRFYGMKNFEVHDNAGKVEYLIKPTEREQFKQVFNNDLDKLVDKNFRDIVLENAEITPKCETENEIYVDPYGNIMPCCWIGSEYLEEPVKETIPIHHLRNLSIKNTKDIMSKIGVFRIQSRILETDSILFSNLKDFWKGKDKCMVCVKVCSKVLYNTRKK